jgi:fusion and transport protein UGO1
MALAMPFEVGKTLLQVEYRPRKRFAPIEEEVIEEKVEEEVDVGLAFRFDASFRSSDLRASQR